MHIIEYNTNISQNLRTWKYIALDFSMLQNLHESVQEMLEEIETDQSHLANQISIMEDPTHDDSRLSVADNNNRSQLVRSRLDFEEEVC